VCVRDVRDIVRDITDDRDVRDVRDIRDIREVRDISDVRDIRDIVRDVTDNGDIVRDVTDDLTLVSVYEFVYCIRTSSSINKYTNLCVYEPPRIRTSSPPLAEISYNNSTFAHI
jgi:hypothetical protein